MDLGSGRHGTPRVMSVRLLSRGEDTRARAVIDALDA